MHLLAYSSLCNNDTIAVVEDSENLSETRLQPTRKKKAYMRGGPFRHGLCFNKHVSGVHPPRRHTAVECVAVPQTV